jgi:hypothetical protein
MKQAHDDPTSSILARENGFGALEACASCTAVSAMVTKSRETAAASLERCIASLYSQYFWAYCRDAGKPPSIMGGHNIRLTTCRPGSRDRPALLEHISVGWNRGIPNALSMSESAGIDSFFGASDAEALFRRLACPSD